MDSRYNQPMPKPSAVDKVYVSAYVGMGSVGISYRDQLRKKAKSHGMSLSNYILAAGLGTLVADTRKPVADTQPKMDPETLPPSLRSNPRPLPAITYTITNTRPARARDTGEGFEPPTITEPAPNSKPITTTVE